ncbi:MAG: hypothetical protein RSB72_02740 [Bacilli bacterium]
MKENDIKTFEDRLTELTAKMKKIETENKKLQLENQATIEQNNRLGDIIAKNNETNDPEEEIKVNKRSARAVSMAKSSISKLRNMNIANIGFIDRLINKQKNYLRIKNIKKSIKQLEKLNINGSLNSNIDRLKNTLGNEEVKQEAKQEVKQEVKQEAKQEAKQESKRKIINLDEELKNITKACVENSFDFVHTPKLSDLKLPESGKKSKKVISSMKYPGWAFDKNGLLKFKGTSLAELNKMDLYAKGLAGVLLTVPLIGPAIKFVSLALMKTCSSLWQGRSLGVQNFLHGINENINNFLGKPFNFNNTSGKWFNGGNYFVNETAGFMNKLHMTVGDASIGASIGAGTYGAVKGFKAIKKKVASFFKDKKDKTVSNVVNNATIKNSNEKPWNINNDVRNNEMINQSNENQRNKNNIVKNPPKDEDLNVIPLGPVNSTLVPELKTVPKYEWQYVDEDKDKFMDVTEIKSNKIIDVENLNNKEKQTVDNVIILPERQHSNTENLENNNDLNKKNTTEFIEGTNVLLPRKQKENESANIYEQYLHGYFDANNLDFEAYKANKEAEIRKENEARTLQNQEEEKRANNIQYAYSEKFGLNQTTDINANNSAFANVSNEEFDKYKKVPEIKRDLKDYSELNLSYQEDLKKSEDSKKSAIIADNIEALESLKQAMDDLQQVKDSDLFIERGKVK